MSGSTVVNPFHLHETALKTKQAFIFVTSHASQQIQYREGNESAHCNL